jgi:hypothetical protein
LIDAAQGANGVSDQCSRLLSTLRGSIELTGVLIRKEADNSRHRPAPIVEDYYHKEDFNWLAESIHRCTRLTELFKASRI